MRRYTVSPTMLREPLTEKVIQPDAMLVKQLHAYLDFVPENIALAIDLCVADLIKFKNPNRQWFDEILAPKLEEPTP